MFGCSIDYLDNILDKQTLIIKRSPIYLYKTIFWFLLLMGSLISIYYLAINLTILFEILIYLYFGFIMIWILLIFHYLLFYNSKSKIYYLLSDKDKLIKDRKTFRILFYFSLVLLSYSSLFIVIIILVFLLSFDSIGLSSGFIFYLFKLLLVTFFLIISIFLEYLIIKRFYNMEVDLVIFNKSGIKKEVHNSFFSVYPYILKVNDIGKINISHMGIIGNLFDVGSINITTPHEIRHYNYLKNPSLIYKVIQKLLESGKEI